MFSMTKLLPNHGHKSRKETSRQNKTGVYNWATYDKLVNTSIALFGDVTINKTIRTSK